MGVYIKGMNMPRDCYNCKIWSLCWDEKPLYNMIKSNCPLVEVKTPHGRLIDVTKIPYLESADPEVAELVGLALTVIEAEVK